MICPGIQDGPLIVIALLMFAGGLFVALIFNALRGNPIPDIGYFDAAAFMRLTPERISSCNETEPEAEWITFVRGKGFVYGRGDEGLEKPPAA